MSATHKTTNQQNSAYANPDWMMQCAFCHNMAHNSSKNRVVETPTYACTSNTLKNSWQAFFI